MIAQEPLLAPTTKLERASVADAMHRGVVTCNPRTPLANVAKVMAEERIHCVVVVATMPDDEVTLWGVVSDRDVLAAAVSGDVADDTAAGSAATEVITVTPQVRLLDAAELMDEHGLMHVVVVEPGTTMPIGVLSALDVVAAVGGAWPTPSVAAVA